MHYEITSSFFKMAGYTNFLKMMLEPREPFETGEMSQSSSKIFIS
jgi:hypothetical protein